MDENQSQFLNSVCNGFEKDLEKKYAAQSLLSSSLSSEPSSEDSARKRLLAADKRPPWLIRSICVAMIIVGFVLISIPAYKLYQMSGIFGRNNLFGIPMPTSEYEPWSFYFQDLSAQDKLLLFGDTTKPDEVSQKEAFWRFEPDNPGAYIEYLTAYRSINGKYPDEMLDVAKEVDPKNALYLLYLAGELADESTNKVYAGSSSSTRGGRRGRRKASPPVGVTPPAIRKHVEITDKQKHREALDLLHRATAMKSCSTYSSKMMQRRLPLLERDGSDWVSRMLPMMYMGSQAVHSFQLKGVSDAIQAEAYRCEQENDVEAFKRLIDDWKHYCMLVHDVSDTLIDGLILRAVIHAPCKEFSLAAKACDLPKMEKYFEALDKQLTDEKIARRAAGVASDWDDELHKQGSIMSTMSLPVIQKQVNDSSAIPKPDTRADRLADHAFWNRITSAGQWLILLIGALIAWLFQFRDNTLVRKIGDRLIDVYSWKDWSFVVVCGVFLPVVSYWLINGLRTGVSVQNWNLSYAGMLLPSGQTGSLVLLLLLAPMLAASHRLNKALPFREKLGLRMLWAAVILVLLAMPLFGLVGSFDGIANELIKAGFATQGLAVVILIACPFVAMVQGRRGGGTVLAKAARSKILAVTYLAVALIMALHVHVYHSLEKHWVAEDEVFRLSEENTSFTTFESDVARQLFKEMNDLIQQINTEL